MNPDFAIVLNFKLESEQNADADFLVKTARNVGARAVSGGDFLKKACAKYTIFLADEQNGVELTKDNVIDTLVQNRKNGKTTVINLTVNADGKFNANDQAVLDQINKWMHMFGHAFNEGKLSNLTVDQDGLVLENRHANYQKYVFLKSPLPEKIVVSGLEKAPNRVEWIENRIDLDFSFAQNKLSINLVEPDDEFEWQVLRIQAHRPEDDLAETKF